MKQSEIIKFLSERFPRNKYEIGSVKQISGRSYITVTDKLTGEKIRIEINGSQIIESGDRYVTIQFNDDEGKICVDKDGKIIDFNDKESKEEVR